MGHNCRVKTYPSGAVEILCSSADIWECEPVARDRACPVIGTEPGGGEGRDRAIRRARAKVRDYALCSGMTHFVTLTTSPDQVDRYDDQEVVRKMRRWADNYVQRYGMAYVIIPERHKDGAIHFHGLLRAENVKMIDSGTISGIRAKPARPKDDRQRAAWLEKGGHIVYNLPGWRLGYSTAIALYGSYDAAVAYTCKYIGKDIRSDKIGGRWYYSGGQLAGPEISYCSMAPDQVDRLGGEVYRFDVPGAGLHMALVRMDAPESTGDV